MVGVVTKRKPLVTAHCPSGKTRFLNETAAYMNMLKHQARARDDGSKPPVRTYYHEVCSGWHMTSLPLPR